MNRTRVVFVLVVLLAVLIVGASLILSQLGRGPEPLAPVARGPIEVRILTALPVEPWVREAARQFTAENRTLSGQPIRVEVVAMDGLTALGRWDRDDFGVLGDRAAADLTAEERERLARFPTAWIPDSRYLTELANASYKERLGRDVFLTDGEYRVRPVIISLFVWGVYESRLNVLQQRYPEIDWRAIHDAATARGGWPELGGDAQWGFFKLVVPNPRKNAGGLVAMIAAAGEYYDRTRIDTADVTDPAFQRWLGELMGAVTDVSGASAYTAEDFALFGYSVGDGGQLLESDLLTNMAGIVNRWEDPLSILYPKYVTWFDFPFSIWMGPETSALEKNAALMFQEYLLSPEVQRRAIALGLRPVNPDVSVTDTEDSPFVRWADRGVVPVVPRANAMRPPDRDVLLALLRWFDLNVATQ